MVEIDLIFFQSLDEYASDEIICLVIFCSLATHKDDYSVLGHGTLLRGVSSRENSEKNWAGLHWSQAFRR